VFPESKIKMSKATAEQTLFFENKVRPLLAESCFSCHGGDPKKEAKAGLDMTSLEGMLLGGDSGPSLVPGNLDKSLIIEAVRYRNDDMAMPPKKPLPPEKVKILEEWVSSGAPWPGFEGELAVGKEGSEEPYDWDKFRRQHWSFKPVVKAIVPPAPKDGWAKNDLDRFVLAKLKSEGLDPNPQATKRILLRRAYLDLLGLVPKPEEVQEFMEDDSPDAFPKLVDRLLDSEHYGERWARHWLDVARYSDGLGGFGDGQDLPGAWRYRDWVVKALNEDMPYDEFARRQIAGDCLEEESKDPIATGFFAVGPTYKGDGGDAEATNAAKAETLSDRVDTFSRAFLGLTAACARCHDHKFDPISIKDYYSIAGIFNNSRINLNHPLGTKEEIDAHNQGNALVKKKQNELNAWSAEVREDGMRELMRQSGDHLLALYRYHRQRKEEGAIPDRNKYATENGIEPKRLDQWERTLKDGRNKGKFPLLATWFEKSPLEEKTSVTETELSKSIQVYRDHILALLNDLDKKDLQWREDMKTQGKKTSPTQGL
jgi:cytochrome c553